MTTILITGGAGFIGANLCRILKSSAVQIRILDSLSSQVHGELPSGLSWLSSSSVEFVRASILDPQALSKALDGVECVVHLAAETGTGQSMYAIANYNQVNSQGTALLLDVIANSPNRTVERIVLTSSRSVYGEGSFICPACVGSSVRQFPQSRSLAELSAHKWEPSCNVCGFPLQAVATRESDQVLPASIYAATKYAQEDLVRVACGALGMDYAILRLQNVFGEGQSLNNPYTGILSIFSTRIRRGLELPIFEDGLESRDFVHVEDVARAIQSCALSSEPINRVINVGSGISTSVLEVAKQLMASLNMQAPVRITSEYRLGDIRHNFADITRLRQLLPDCPRITLAEGLDRFAAWVQSQPLPEDQLERANSELRDRKLMG
ncbi:NAD-dependent epimerase/dehydratase family protein [Cyanobium sp. ATX 6F1]|uniref:NAD-dependent epimerase/dehydratase family protein n=1 Tax=unclassified Cyanobium TaxID=2627006 RepID=UPI0020CBBCB9|nr:NAD-dependent epimerase/dehydratase family protein [Cyanobium sp. ATX 6F1]MCP9916641.1 NAD-dependent epimerase/dehydratase family protein [Cyanobium sp. ATX 6F1]